MYFFSLLNISPAFSALIPNLLINNAVVNAFLQDWISFWQSNNWKTKGKEQVKNIELWTKLLDLCKTHKVHWNKVKGHSDNQLNNLCDSLARGEIEKLKSSN